MSLKTVDTGAVQSEIRGELVCSLEAAETFLGRFREWASERWTFSSELLLREALANAVAHGANGQPLARILCVVRLKRDRLLIAVSDEGAGFDWRAALGRDSFIAEPRGRGVEIFRNYADRIHFNTKGNAVALMQRVGERKRNECHAN